MNVKYDKNISFKLKKHTFKLENSERILEYLENFIKNSSTKNVNGYGTIGLAKNTIRTYKSLYHIIVINNIFKIISIFLSNILQYLWLNSRLHASSIKNHPLQ